MGLSLTLLCSWPHARAADPPGAIDELLRLVPPDASLVVTLEGLRDQVRSLGGSRLIADLRQLPAVKSWFESEKYRHLEQSGAAIEAALGVKLAEIRDQVFGDAVVLVLRLPPGVPTDPSQARGLLLLRARDPSMLHRLVTALNAAQQKSGELRRVSTRSRASTSYHVREFPEGSPRPPEWFVDFPDGTFAFSNSEEMIWGVIDRKPPQPMVPAVGPPQAAKPDAITVSPGLGKSPRVLAVRRRLPERPLARLYLDPRAVERLLALAPPPAKPSDARFLEMLRRHLAAVDYAGAALSVRSRAIVVDAVETLDASKVDGWLRRWAGDSRPDRRDLRRVPRTAMALASAHLEMTAFRDALYQLVPESEHPKLRNLEALMTGLMLGQDFASRILPALGPGVIAYLDSPPESAADRPDGEDRPPGRGGLFPLVIAADLPAGSHGPNPGGDPGGPSGVVVSDAIENALRTLLTIMALDEKRGQGRAALTTTEAAGASVTTLNIPIPFAFAIDRVGGRLVLGTTAPAVARYLEAASDPEAGGRFRDWRAAAFPSYETFLCVDLEALTRLGGQHRDRLARRLAARQNRPAEEVVHDLEHVLALARLFRAAFIASRVEPDATALHRSFGLIVPESRGPAGTTP